MQRINLLEKIVPFIIAFWIGWISKPHLWLFVAFLGEIVVFHFIFKGIYKLMDIYKIGKQKND